MRNVFRLLLLASLPLFGCTGFDSPPFSLYSQNGSPVAATSAEGVHNVGALPSDGISVHARVQGLLFRRGDASVALGTSLPPNATPLGGQTVSAFAPGDELLGSVTTAADGTFTLEALEGTQAELRFLGQMLPVSLVDGKSILLDPPAVSRQQAAIQVRGLANDANALIALTFNPLPEGTAVAPAFDEQAQAHVVGAAGEYLALIDHHPGDQWSKPVQYVFVNAASGATTTVEASWWPRVEDVLYFDYAQQLTVPMGNQFSLSNLVVQLPTSQVLPKASPPTKARVESYKTAENPDLFVFLLAGNPENWFMQDRRRLAEWARTQGVPEANLFESKLGSLWEPPITRSQRIRDEFLRFAAPIQARAQAGGHPVLILGISAHGDEQGAIVLTNGLAAAGRRKLKGGGLQPSDFVFRPAALFPLHELQSACHIEVLLSCCYAFKSVEGWRNSFPPDLGPQIEIYTSSHTGVGGGSDAINDAIQSGVNPFGVLGGLISSPDTDGTDMIRSFVKTAYLDEDGYLQSGVSYAPWGPAGPKVRNDFRYFFQPSSLGPQLESITPNPRKGGELLTVTGKNLGGGGTQVRLGGGPQLTLDSVSPTRLVVRPINDFAGRLVVKVGCRKATSERIDSVRVRDTRYFVKEISEVVVDFLSPDLADFDFRAIDVTGQKVAPMFLNQNGSLSLAAFAFYKGTHDGNSGFQVSQGTPNGLEFQLQGTLGAEGQLPRTLLTETYRAGLHTQLDGEFRVRAIEWVPQEVQAMSQLVVDYRRRFPSPPIPDRNSTYEAVLTKKAEGTIGLNVTIDGYFLKLAETGDVTSDPDTGRLSVSLNAYSPDATYELFTSGELDRRGFYRGKLEWRNLQSRETEFGDFNLLPDVPAQLNLNR